MAQNKTNMQSLLLFWLSIYILNQNCKIMWIIIQNANFELSQNFPLICTFFSKQLNETSFITEIQAFKHINNSLKMAFRCKTDSSYSMFDPNAVYTQYMTGIGILKDHICKSCCLRNLTVRYKSVAPFLALNEDTGSIKICLYKLKLLWDKTFINFQ